MANVAKGKVQYNQSLPVELVARWKEWVENQPGTLTETQHLEWAILRHMETPPGMPKAPPVTPVDPPTGEEPPPGVSPRGKAGRPEGVKDSTPRKKGKK